jgi:hypothetical protein
MTFMNAIRSTAAAAAILVGTSTVASAVTLGSIVDVSDGGDNDGVKAIYEANSRQGYYGANLYLIGTADIMIEYLGAEAGFNNLFTFEGETFNTGGITNVWDKTGIGLAKTVSNVVGGLLNFSFSANSNLANTVTNGSNPDGSGTLAAPDFFVSFDGGDGTATSGQSVTLWFDDGGTDDNHDDMAVRLSVVGGTISTVPLPAAGWLLLGAFGGLGALRRFRKS